MTPLRSRTSIAAGGRSQAQAPARGNVGAGLARATPMGAQGVAQRQMFGQRIGAAMVPSAAHSRISDSAARPAQHGCAGAHCHSRAAHLGNQTPLQLRAQPATAIGRANTASAQLRPVGGQVGANRLSAANLNRPGNTTPTFGSKAPDYSVQAPIQFGPQGRQIKATIKGTPQVAGSVEVSPQGGGRVFISNLAVDHQHRKRGVASQLIDAAIATARRQGFKTARLEARPSDGGIAPQSLVSMYQRMGFKSVGKSHRGSPLMERKL
jgi:ribosomal protein S18 acetylase RimI-like enzyme